MNLEAIEAANKLGLTPRSIDRLAKEHGPEVARWAFAQAELRERAKAKFSRASSMLFVREALEQATHEAIAAYHASLFPVGELVIDATLGIGSDAMALAARGPVQGFELDEERLRYAEHNVALVTDNSDLRLGDSLAFGWDAHYVFADPSRRIDSRRTLDIDDFSPAPARLATRMRSLKLGVMKLSPMLGDADLINLSADIQFVSFGGECREVLVSFGEQATSRRRSVHVESGIEIEATTDPTVASDVGDFVYDCDPAVVRSHSVGTLCRLHELSVLGDSGGYVTGGFARSPVFRSYRSVEQGAFDLNRIRRLLRALGSATPILKQRQAGLDLAKTQRSLRLEGSLATVLLLYKVGKSIRFVLATPAVSERDVGAQ